MIKIRWSWLLKNLIGADNNGYAAMAFFIFLFYRDNKPSEKTLRHEYIHLFQQLELLFIGQWLLYIISTLINLIKYKNYRKAYKNNIFEKEAYANDQDVNYLINRKPYAWVKYYNK